MDSATKINSTTTAYKIGFSDSLNPNYFSAYNELSKYLFNDKNKRKLMRFFLNGCRDGFKIKCEVKRELEAGVVVAH